MKRHVQLAGNGSQDVMFSGTICKQDLMNNKHRWMDGMLVYILFNIISIISGRLQGDNERLYSMETPFTIEKISASGN